MYEKLLHKTKLNHHHYTGKMVHHSHTMYSWLLAFLIIAACALGMASYTLADVRADQGSVTIGGVVRAPTPSEPPVILTPPNGTTVRSRVVTIGGSCKPGLFIEVYSNGFFVGSTTCDDSGVFSLPISLFSGQNEIRAYLFSNLSDNGPSSEPLLITYVEPPELQKSGVGSLIVKLTEHYKGGVEDTEISLTPEIVGGEGPYDIHVDWKDGASFRTTAQKEGKVSATHVYSEPGNYSATISAADSHGRIYEIDTLLLIAGAPVSSAVPPSTSSGLQLPTVDGMKAALAQGWVTLTISGMMLGAFWIGQKIAYANMLRQIRITKFPPRK